MLKKINFVPSTLKRMKRKILKLEEIIISVCAEILAWWITSCQKLCRRYSSIFIVSC
jgi:hypothetical protein